MEKQIEKSTIVNVHVEWAEGNGKLDGKNFQSLSALMRAIESNAKPPTLGYDKHKIHILWSDGQEMIHRYDYGDRDKLGNLITLNKDVRDALRDNTEFLTAHGLN